MSAQTILAGAARLPLSPPLGLPMLGFIRQATGAEGYGRLPLETTALVLRDPDAAGGARTVVLCGIDVAYVPEPEAAMLVERISAAVGADPAAVLVNFNHTHLAPHGGTAVVDVFGDLPPDRWDEVARAARMIQEQALSVCIAAASALEPARTVWGVGVAPLAANRRERRASDGRTILGWNPAELVDEQVTTLQARRPDESAIATLIAYGCHPVTTGYDMSVFSADYPGAGRRLVRQVTGGECVFFQASGGNVLPRVAFTGTEDEAERVGERLALESLHSVADRRAFPVRAEQGVEGSVTPISTYRAIAEEAPSPVLAATRERVAFPLLSHPTLAEHEALLADYEEAYGAALASGSLGEQKVAWFGVGWGRRVRQELIAGTAVTETSGPIHAVRIGDGVIVTGPGETFTEIGMAVKERAPGRPTLYCGYTNGLLAYFATAAEHAFGGYEPGYSYRGVRLPSAVDPAAERLLVETAVRLAERLFPEASPWLDGAGWTATGASQPLLPGEPLLHPTAR